MAYYAFSEFAVAAEPHLSGEKRIERTEPPLSNSQPGCTFHHHAHIRLFGCALVRDSLARTALYAPVRHPVTVNQLYVQPHACTETTESDRKFA